MTQTKQRLCSWDSESNDAFNYWTIGNVSEVLPGVTRPLYASLSRQADYEATRQVAEAIDSLDLVPSFAPPVSNFSGIFAGRWAMNLAWCNAIIQTWQTGDGSGLMAQYVTSTDGQDISAGTAVNRSRAEQTFRKVKRVWGQLPRTVAADRRAAEELRRRERGLDLSAKSERQLWRHLLNLERAQTRAFAHHLFVSGAAGEYTGWLGKFLDRALPGHDPALVIALTSALRDVESARPGIGAWDLARFVASRPALRQAFNDLPIETIEERLRERPDAGWHEFASHFQGFIDEFGFRGQGEVDPSYADWEEEPAFALSAIKASLHAGDDRDPRRMEERCAQQREGIEAAVLEQLSRPDRVEFRRLLAGAQRFTRLRESSKANWVRLIRLSRPALLELGQRFAERGLLAKRDHIFFLLREEVEAAVRGGLTAAVAQAVVEQRTAEYQQLQQYELPEVFQTPAPASRRTAAQAPANNVLQGMPVSAGTAQGPARVVLSAEAAMEATLEPGEVLVAPYTDAPWTPLFIPAAAVVVETGGILSHAATVAREFGIPAVVAVKGATRLIRDGQLVTVDGRTGAVTID